jgi:hypothetical protein
LQAFKTEEEFGVFCAANWKPGEEALEPNVFSNQQYLQRTCGSADRNTHDTNVSTSFGPSVKHTASNALISNGSVACASTSHITNLENQKNVQNARYSLAGSRASQLEHSLATPQPKNMHQAINSLNNFNIYGGMAPTVQSRSSHPSISSSWITPQDPPIHAGVSSSGIDSTQTNPKARKVAGTLHKMFRGNTGTTPTGSPMPGPLAGIEERSAPSLTNKAEKGNGTLDNMDGYFDYEPVIAAV